ncbi:hypothetical protein WJX73_003087 [Symbiochloris irregularis]|uniref:Adenylosuccinate synthetase, chloroplastic n=1 Tax=Symbiochloris irregularis TaxID=706552 RepID=A0AAW1NI20_9CHLO
MHRECAPLASSCALPNFHCGTHHYIAARRHVLQSSISSAKRRRPTTRLFCQAESSALEESFDPRVAVVLGMQWGDEGKGKIVDILARKYSIVARAQGGANAGHTVYDDEGNKYALHLVPSGILNKNALCVVGNGVVVHLPGLFEEILELEQKGVTVDGRLLISDRAHLLFDLHKEIDGLREEELAGGKIGTTRRGIGPAYASKAQRNGVRVGELKDLSNFADKLRRLADDGRRRFDNWQYDVEADIEKYKEIAQRIQPFIADTVAHLNDAYDEGQRILVEGANATMLDLDVGTYPFVTSSNCSVGGVAAGTGLAPTKFEAIIGVVKAYTSRVGAGPFPTELHGDLEEHLRKEGAEYGTTTGRPRRVGWLDLVAVRFAARVNGLTHINLTKLDVLDQLDTIKLGVRYTLNGQPITSVPAQLEQLEQVQVEYEELPGWQSDISKVRQWSDLPENAQKLHGPMADANESPYTRSYHDDR